MFIFAIKFKIIFALIISVFVEFNYSIFEGQQKRDITLFKRTILIERTAEPQRTQRKEKEKMGETGNSLGVGIRLYPSNYQLLVINYIDTSQILGYKNSITLTDEWLDNTIKEQIKDQVNHSFRRIAPILNTWLVILLMLPTVMIVNLWLLWFKLAQQSQANREEIQRLKYDAIAHIHSLTSEAKIIVNGIQEQIEIAQPNINISNAETSLLSQQQNPEERTDV